MLFRVAMFVVVGAVVMWLNEAMGADPSVLPWSFILGGLGAVAAVDAATWWLHRQRPH